MERSTPPWVWAVLVFLAVAAVCERLPEPPSDEVRARARELSVEHDPRAMCARELRQLPGVGHKLALVLARTRDAHRGEQPLRWEDVPGIGEVRAREIRAWCRARGIEPDPLRPGHLATAPGASGYPVAMAALAHAASTSCLAFLAGCGGAGSGTTSSAAAAAVDPQDTAAPRSRTLALQGGALHALEAGPAGGALVLLLHGARFSARTWEELGTLEHLARSGYRAVALDWPGYGATSGWASPPDAATLLDSVCDELGAERVVLVGPSLGGRFAFEFLRSEAARVAALVAIAPAGAEGFAPARWETPTLLLWGERDEVLPLEQGRALAGRLPGARLEVLAGASHPCYLDQPERFHALLLEFLQATMPAGR